MRRLYWLSVLPLLAACGTSPLTPTQVPIVHSSTPSPALPSVVAQAGWPQAYPDGQFGHEDPSFSPTIEQCPPNYHPEYNGWNWVCRDRDGNTELPRIGGWPNYPSVPAR